MYRPARILLSTKNLLNNISVIRHQAGSSHVIAMVKGNGYGHGIRSVARRIEEHVDCLGVCSLDEGMILRHIGITKPILLNEGVFAPEGLLMASENRMDVVFHAEEQIAWLSQKMLPYPINVWIKVDTGMGRLGFLPNEVLQIYKTLKERKDVSRIGIMSHLACADTKDHPVNAIQISQFHELKKEIPDCVWSLNSAAGLFHFPELNYDFVRPGLAIYGHSPCNGISDRALGLTPVMTFMSRIIAVKTKSYGDVIGYGARYVCDKSMRVAIVACGYGDGYPRTTQDGAPVLIRGIVCPLVGRVSMDMLTVDVSHLETVRVNDEVILWGEDLPFDKITPFNENCSYDMLSGIQNRVSCSWTA